MRIVDGHSKLIDSLIGEAANDPRRRKAVVLSVSQPDGSSVDPCQRLINVMLPGTYVAPHRYAGWQHIVVLRGRVVFMTWNCRGCHAGNYVLGPGDTVIIDDTDTAYHSWAVAEGPVAIYEVRPGPYRGPDDCQYLQQFPPLGGAFNPEDIVRQWDQTARLMLGGVSIVSSDEPAYSTPA
jgi:cupin fold WbuC family metalloprotein